MDAQTSRDDDALARDTKHFVVSFTLLLIFSYWSDAFFSSVSFSVSFFFVCLPCSLLGLIHPSFLLLLFFPSFPFTSSVSIFFLRELVNHHLHVHFAKSKKNCLIVQHFYLLISLIWSISPSGWTSAFRDPLFCFSCLLSFVCTRRTPVYLHFS